MLRTLAIAVVIIVVLLAQRQFARRLPERYNLDSSVHGSVIVIGGLSLWRFLSLWIDQQATGFYQTAAWAVLALVFFVVGFWLRERVYRWLGLTVLACAIGRALIIDIAHLEAIYKVMSFMALGVVLLVLGFLYNKYQEKIKEWL